MKPVFEVFVIGPMGAEKDDPQEQATPISQHMRAIKQALDTVLPACVKPSELESNVFTPEDGGSEIETYVFNRIDSADLAVADITARSPSVMYELAFFHALGTPVIILDYDDGAGGKVPFYLRGANILRVPDFEVETLEKAFEGRLRMFFDETDDQDFALNPLTRFYSAPLVEAAGAATIARGYFLNLIDPILSNSGGVMSQEENAAIRTLNVVRPENLLNFNEELQVFARIARDWNGGESLQETHWEVVVSGRRRKVTAYLLGNAIYDFPRTINALTNAPRMQRVLQKIPGSAGYVSETRLELNRLRVTSQLQRHFFDVLLEEIRRHAPRLYANRIRFISLRQFADDLGVPLG